MKIFFVSNKKIIAPINSFIVALNAVQKMENKRSIYAAAMKIRYDDSVLQKKWIPESVSAEDLLNGEINYSIPESLLYILQTVFSGSKIIKSKQHAKKVVVSWVAQDIIFSARDHKMKPSKHTCLGLTIKTSINWYKTNRQTLLSNSYRFDCNRAEFEFKFRAASR